MSIEHEHQQVGRRAWLKHSTLLLTAAATFDANALMAAEDSKSLRIALLTDLHHADKPSAGTRYYRETLGKLSEAAKQFEVEKPDFVVELGDLVDAAETAETELQYLATVNREFSKLSADRHYVLGNHCVDTLTKAEFLAGVEREKSYYSFDRGEFHFVVLDACFLADGQPYGRKNFKWTDTNLPDAELKWLESDLRQNSRKTIVFAHQRLDVSDNHGVKNSPAVRRILESSGKVLAVFQGHSHQNDLKEIANIHYCTLVAMVEGTGAENNGYSLADLYPDGSIKLKGFRKQASYDWPANGS